MRLQFCYCSRHCCMIDCDLVELPNGKWWCPECDKEKKLLLPFKSHRNCRAKLPEDIKTIREKTVSNNVKRFLIEGLERTQEEIKKVRDICFECTPHWDHKNGGCKAFFPACRRLAQTEMIWRSGRCVLRPEWRKW